MSQEEQHEFNRFTGELARYRKLNAQKKQLEVDIKPLKKSLLVYVEANGKWEDDQGYARINARKPAWKISGGDAHDLASVWSQSPDPATQVCGQLLMQKLSQSAGSTYIQVK